MNSIGDIALLHLLTETSIFIPLPNDCYCQLTGKPLIYLSPANNGIALRIGRSARTSEDSVTTACKRKSPDETSTERSQKRFRCKKDSGTKSPTRDLYVGLNILHKSASECIRDSMDNKQKKAAADIPLARISLFYSRPSRQGKTGHILLGLPPDRESLHSGLLCLRLSVHS